MIILFILGLLALLAFTVASFAARKADERRCYELFIPIMAWSRLATALCWAAAAAWWLIVHVSIRW